VQNLALHKSPWQPVFLRVWRLCLLAVVLGNLVGISGNLASAACETSLLLSCAKYICNIIRSYFFQAADIHAQAAIAWAGNSTTAFSMYADGKARMSDAIRTAGINRFCEMAILLILVIAFCMVGFQSLRIVSLALRSLANTEKKLALALQPVSDLAADGGASTLQSERGSDAQQIQLDRSLQIVVGANRKGQKLKQKVLMTFLFVFLTCLLRSAFQSFYGLAQDGSSHGSQCSASPCDPCKNQWTLISFWIVYTPALQNIVILIASPLAVLVALWGMTNVGEIEQMSQL
jgi:hypothetical protein